MEEWYEEPKVIINGVERYIVVHKQRAATAGPRLCIKAHSHSYIEILYCLSGVHEAMLNWKPYQFGPGDMVLINSREIHQVRCISEERSCYLVLRFEPELLYSIYPNTFEIKYMLPFITNKTPTQKVFSAAEIKDTFIPTAFDELLTDYETQPYCYELALHTNIYRIFLWILRYWHKKGIVVDNIIDDVGLMKRFQSVLDYMYKHYAEDLTVSELAERYHLSYSYFSRMFKKIVGQNFREYLNYIRIKKAEQLLVTTDLNITEIAMEIGFSSSSYFVQQFKEHKKVSPRQFRKKYRNPEGITPAP